MMLLWIWNRYLKIYIGLLRLQEAVTEGRKVGLEVLPCDRLHSLRHIWDVNGLVLEWKCCVCLSLLEQKPKHESIWYVSRRQVSCLFVKSYISKLKLQGSSAHITSHHHLLTISKAVGNLAPTLPLQLGIPCCRSMPHAAVVLSDDPSPVIILGSLQKRLKILWYSITHHITLGFCCVCPVQDLHPELGDWRGGVVASKNIMQTNSWKCCV